MGQEDGQLWNCDNSYRISGSSEEWQSGLMQQS